MDYHQNARLTIHRREQLARKVLVEGCTLKLAAASFGVSARTAAKWVGRYREQGRSGLRDRSSRPHRLPRQTAAWVAEQVETLRRQRWTGVRIAQATGLSRATVSRILRRLRLKHRFTRPYTPRTNGKAERFIQTALREWAYARAYDHSQQRTQELRPWLHQYNWHRPHGALALAPPITRSDLDTNNLLRLHN